MIKILKKIVRKIWILEALIAQFECHFGHRQILSLAKTQHHIILNPTPTFGRQGSIQTYYHFMFDLCLPLKLVLDQTPSTTHFYLQYKGPLITQFKQLFSDRVSIIESSNSVGHYPEVPLMGMNPYIIPIKKSILDSYKSFVFKQSNLNLQDTKPNLVLLIERIAPHPFYESTEADRQGSGTSRRSILNHNDLSQELNIFFKKDYVFKNIQLENMPLNEQCSLFHQAKVVIGQRGAGFANILFMQSGGSVIEISNNQSKKHLRKLSEYKGLSHNYYSTSDTQDEHLLVNTDHFIKWLKQKVL